MGDPAMTSEREFWTVGTRDFRNILGVEFKSSEAAKSFLDWARLSEWVVVNVTETDTGRAYMSPDLPEGPRALPAAGTF